MSLKDDLLRNRKVFEILTGSESIADMPSTPLRKSSFASDSSAEAYAVEPPETFVSEAQEPNRQGVRTQADTPQTAEIFSLKFGRRMSRETGMSLKPPMIESIAFPTLQKTEAPAASDPLDSLYHRLECDARRASQILGEEEY